MIRRADSVTVEALRRIRPDLLDFRRPLTRRQEIALASWKRHGTVKAVAAELGISESAARQLLSCAGAIQTRPGFYRQRAARMLREGYAPEVIQARLRIHRITLELAIGDYAATLVDESLTKETQTQG